MWLFTAVGFFSIVRTRPSSPRDAVEAQCVLVVRSRSHADALAFSKVLAGMGVDAPVKVTPQADYPFRLFAHEQHVAAAVGGMLLALDYGNFKQAVLKHQGVCRMSAYHDVWEVMLKAHASDRPVQPDLQRTARHEGPKRVSGRDDGDGNCDVCGLPLENDEGTVHVCPAGFHDGGCPLGERGDDPKKCTCMKHLPPVKPRDQAEELAAEAARLAAANKRARAPRRGKRRRDK